jgi:hypothetical protein
MKIIIKESIKSKNQVELLLIIRIYTKRIGKKTNLGL